MRPRLGICTKELRGDNVHMIRVTDIPLIRSAEVLQLLQSKLVSGSAQSITDMSIEYLGYETLRIRTISPAIDSDGIRMLRSGLHTKRIEMQSECWL